MIDDNSAESRLDIREPLQLWRKLQGFSFDGPGVKRTFAQRLAEEQGWTLNYAQRVMEEYRRFLMLTAVAGHAVCPSEAVDAAWHQHLVFTRSYWHDLCQETLGFPLHHSPSTGGASEYHKHWKMYQQTLLSYQQQFGEPPPHDIWEPLEKRFAAPVRPVRSSHSWVISKPRWGSHFRQSISGRYSPAVAFVLGPCLAVGLGPFGWDGPTFLTFYWILFLSVLLLGAWYLRRACDLPEPDSQELTPAEIACLSFGRTAAVNTTIAGMIHRRELETHLPDGLKLAGIEGAKVKIATAENIPAAGEELQSAIYAAVQPQPLTLAQIHSAVAPETASLLDRLQHQRWLTEPDRVSAARWMPTMAMFVLATLATIKVLWGWWLGSPVGLLFISGIVTLITALLFATPPRLTLSAKRRLKQLKKQHKQLPKHLESDSSNESDILLAAGLFGVAGLTFNEMRGLEAAWRHTASTQSSLTFSAGAGGCGIGCGGGGCGGGGCGGGCGGCG